MKIKFCLMSVCMLFIFACKNKQHANAQADLIGKWNVFEIETQIKDSTVVSTQGRGANIVFIYYVENGIEFFKDDTFNMRIANEDGVYKTYDTLSGSHFTWELEGDLIILKSTYDSNDLSDREHILRFSLNNNILILEQENNNIFDTEDIVVKYRLRKN